MVSRLLARCLVAASVSIALFLVLTQHLHGAAHVLDAIHRAKHKDGTTAARPAGAKVEVEDKVIVMAKLQHEDTDWVAEHLPDWQRAIYTVDAADPYSPYRVPKNKGHEAMAYLTYLIDHYDHLPSTLAFIHSHRGGYATYFTKSWHIDATGFDNVASLASLNLPFIQQNGYANLRCNWAPGCKPKHRKNKHVTPEIWNALFNASDTSSSSPSNDGNTTSSSSSSPLSDPAPSAPALVGAACCAQFAVSSRQVQRRPRTDYVRFRDWILQTELTDAKSGRVMEFLWHIIFGRDAVYCPDPQKCYCDVYGQC